MKKILVLGILLFSFIGFLSCSPSDEEVNNNENVEDKRGTGDNTGNNNDDKGKDDNNDGNNPNVPAEVGIFRSMHEVDLSSVDWKFDTVVTNSISTNIEDDGQRTNVITNITAYQKIENSNIKENSIMYLVATYAEEEIGYSYRRGPDKTTNFITYKKNDKIRYTVVNIQEGYILLTTSHYYKTIRTLYSYDNYSEVNIEKGTVKIISPPTFVHDTICIVPSSVKLIIYNQ